MRRREERRRNDQKKMGNFRMKGERSKEQRGDERGEQGMNRAREDEKKGGREER